MSWPQLPARAAYLALRNPARRNALSLAVLQDLKHQLIHYNTSPVDGRLRVLPPFRPEVLQDLEAVSKGQARDELKSEYKWLLDAQTWCQERHGLPHVLVLRSEGPVFSSGHDLGELGKLSHAQVEETFTLCSEVMSLIRHSPAPVICPIQGLATAAGCQLALTADLPIAAVDAQFRLPGASIGLPCTSPSTAVSRRLGAPFTYRMLALAESFRAVDLPGGAIELVSGPGELERRVSEMVKKLADEMAGQPTALGKWAFWTQHGFDNSILGGDGYEEALSWAGRMMALHARSAHAKEGTTAFLEKRGPVWRTGAATL